MIQWSRDFKKSFWNIQKSPQFSIGMIFQFPFIIHNRKFDLNSRALFKIFHFVEVKRHYALQFISGARQLIAKSFVFQFCYSLEKAVNAVRRVLRCPPHPPPNQKLRDVISQEKTFFWYHENKDKAKNERIKQSNKHQQKETMFDGVTSYSEWRRRVFKLLTLFRSTTVNKKRQSSHKELTEGRIR